MAIISMAISLCFLGLIFFFKGHSTNEVAQIISERDSLRIINERQTRRMGNLDNMLMVINSSIDSINRSENSLFVDIKGEHVATPEDAIRNVEKLEELINNQKQRIANLEKQLREAEEMDGPDENLSKMVAYYKNQLAEKDAEIASLKEQLEQKNVNIQQLQSQIGTQAQALAELDKRTAVQSEVLKRQDALLNHCYMRIGEKKVLEQEGIIRKGKIVTQNSLDRSKFSKVDIRLFTELEFEARKPRILTTMPQSSYILTTSGNGHYVLQITNPTEFWSVSNFLVIQTN